MQHRTIPQNLNFSSLNPHIDFSDTPYYLPTENIVLGSEGGEEDSTVLAGVSSFAFGGVNAHVVIESYASNVTNVDEKVSSTEVKSISCPYLIPLSGKDKNSLLCRAQQLVDFLEEACNEGRYEDVIYSKVLASLYTSLNLDPDTGENDKKITLESLNISPWRWINILKDLSSIVDRSVDFYEVQDCLSLDEVAQKIARTKQISHMTHAFEQEALCPRVSVPSVEIRQVGLEQIAYTLMQGRDHFKERLACVAHSKQELLSILRRYIQSPDESYSELWTHSIRFNDPELDKPTARKNIADTDSLESWGRWWLGTKTATLEWKSLYKKSTTPQKFPLPAYPFKLDRIWYKAKQSKEVQDEINSPLYVIKNTSELDSEPFSKPPQDLILPAAVVAAWKVANQQSQLVLPSSLMSLAALIDYAIFKRKSEFVALADIQFGQPCEIDDEKLVFCHVEKGTNFLIQCLSSNSERKILSQATLLSPLPSAENSLKPVFTAAKHLTFEQFQNYLVDKNRSFGPVLQCIKSVAVNGLQLELDLALPMWHAKNGQFWVPLIASVLSGFAYLSQQQNIKFQLPWTVKSIQFNPDKNLTISKLLIIADFEKNQSSVVAMDQNSKQALVMEGIKLRSSDAVRLQKDEDDTDLNRVSPGGVMVASQ